MTKAKQVTGKNSNAARFLCAAIIFTIISYVVNVLGAVADMKYYLDPNYFPVWSRLMMPGPGPPPAEFMYYSLLFTFIIALLFVFVYTKIKAIFKDKNTIKNGLKYGFGVFLVGGIPSAFSLFLLINLPAGLVTSWAIQALVACLINGAVVAKVVR